MKWQFNVPNGSTSIALNAEVICTTHQIEQIQITGKNISFILLSNRPLVEAIERTNMPISWRVFYGDVKDEKLVNNIAKQVEQHLIKQGPAKQVQLFTQVRKTA